MVNPAPVPNPPIPNDPCAPVRVRATIPRRLDDWLAKLAAQAELPKSAVVANILLQAWANHSKSAKLCEARRMDIVKFGNEHGFEPVPECDEPATREVQGYNLCDGCADSLHVLGRFARRLLATGAAAHATDEVLP